MKTDHPKDRSRKVKAKKKERLNTTDGCFFGIRPDGSFFFTGV